MPFIQKFDVIPNIPERLNSLLRIAYNMWWGWHPEAIALFRWLDNELWEQTHHNPIKVIRQIPDHQWQEFLADEVFLAHLDRVDRKLTAYLEHKTWYEKVHKEELGSRIAYFSAEFGLHECLSTYSGGLGVLAGDHLKSSSDLGLPLVGVGLLYRHGYFRQYLNLDGMQQESYFIHDFANLPVTLQRYPDGRPMIVEVEYPHRMVYAQIWRIAVGRVSLYLLDSDIEQNDPHDRQITFHLYGGGLDMRIRQEILLGIGGIRALELLGQSPTVCHMNEGHSAFMALERIRNFKESKGLSFEEAKQLVVATNVFTTHTPVPAGIDVFPPSMIKEYFADYCARMEISLDELLALGRETPHNDKEHFSMAVLALKLAAHANGVSKLHGKVSRKMWRKLWPGLPEEEIPIAHITNGIHTQSWYSDEIARLYDRYLGPKWLDDPVNFKIWERVDKIPDSELWRSHERLRERLIAFARRRLIKHLQQRGAHRSELEKAKSVLDPEALTIGFARRFATYKRATLLFKDPARLTRLLTDKERPVQLIFSGKAHPCDRQGKEFIRQVIHVAGQENLRRHIVFIEDYDIEVARYMVQGVDVWLNTPRRPNEASGTSGMKAAVNGVLNFSILDGWWCEAYQGNNGWALGSGEDYSDLDYQDEVESRELYELLEKEIIPIFYRRGEDDLPRDWIALMKASMKSICPFFNTNRMIEEYVNTFYLPALLQWNLLTSNQMSRLKELASRRQFIAQHWHAVKILEVNADTNVEIRVGNVLPVHVKVNLGAIPPHEVAVEIFHGSLDPGGKIIQGESILMEFHESLENGIHTFKGAIPCQTSGNRGFTVRLLPRLRDASHRFETGLLTWWEE